jgi:hypothetical protein
MTEPIDFHQWLTRARDWLEAQLEACERGELRLFKVIEGQQHIEITQEQIAQLKRNIQEHDRLLTALEKLAEQHDED